MKKKQAFFHTKKKQTRLYTFLKWETPLKTETSTYFSSDCQKDVKKIEISQITNFDK